MDYRQRWELKSYLSERRLDRRIHLVHAVLILLLATFLLDFWYLQVVRGEEFALLAESNRLRRIRLAPTRGALLDRNGEVLASSRPSLSLALRREEPRDFSDQLRRLAPILGVSHESLQQRLRQMTPRPLFEPLILREDVHLKELAWIEARREWFPSVEVQELARRTYPHGPVVAHVLGHVGEVSESELANAEDEELARGDIVGKSGIERAYDRVLRGQHGWTFVSVNTLGRSLPMESGRLGRKPRHGEALGLTLDLRLQKTLVEGLRDEVGAGVFLDPRTGEVLAISSSPTYDPNRFADGITHDEWRAIRDDADRPLHDRAIDSFYAPGSTFKVVLAVAALETNAVDPTETVKCLGAARHYGRRFLCWKRGGHGAVDMQRALAESCNVYFYQLGKTLGIDAIHRHGAAFGLGRATGIDIPGERDGVLPSQAWKRDTLREPWYPGDTISVSIGQGLLALTPIQMAVMMSAIATEGNLPTPHVVAGAEPTPRRVSFSPHTLTLVRTALEDAVRSGTARSAALKGIQVAGKTGTAQVYKHSAGIDSDKLPKAERDHAWFVGYAPAEDPRIAFAVVIEHGGHGGTSAAPVARKVLDVFFAEPEEPAKRDSTSLRAALVVPGPEGRDGRTTTAR